MTSSVFWFYATALYFPFRSYIKALTQEDDQVIENEDLVSIKQFIRNTLCKGSSLSEENPEVFNKFFENVLTKDKGILRFKNILRFYSK